MPQEIINIGSDPGNNGDGDTLRDAFSKTQNNFDLLFTHEIVTDTSLSDHADASVPGTIAFALARIEANGGGAVVIGPGIYRCASTLRIKVDTQFLGSNLSGTVIDALHDGNVIELGTGNPGFGVRCTLEHFTVNMPDSSLASAIKGNFRQTAKGHIEHVEVTGGSPQSWGIRLDGCNEFAISNFKYSGEGSGIAWFIGQDIAINYGDSLITSTDIILKNPNTTGILLEGRGNFIINNILLSRVEVRSRRIDPNTIGIKLSRVSRITLVNVDIERTDIGVENGPNSIACSFFSVFALGCNTDYVEIAPTRNMTILGGFGYFLNNQQLPNRKLGLYEDAFNDSTFVKTGVADIINSTDSDSPIELTLKDSGSTIFTNKDASGIVSYILPEAAFSKSLDFSFSVLVNQELRIYPNNATDHIRGYDGTLDYTLGGDSYIFSSIPGTSGTIRNVSSSWWIMDKRLGSWSSSD